MKRPFSAALVALALFAGAGCAAIDVDEGADVRSVNLTFDIDDAIINGNVGSIQYDVSAIDGSVVDHGAVLLYFRDQGTWTALPYTFGVESPDLAAVDYTVSLGYGFDLRFLEVFMELSTEEVWADVEDRLGGTLVMRAVIIDDLDYSKQTGLDLTDYEAVSDFYGLDD